MTERSGQQGPQTERGPAAAAARQRGEGPRTLRRARQDRGAETRARLISAGLDIFGRHGFEAATTRQIAQVADANLAAILYHFGNKEALYRAVAEHVVGSIAARIGDQTAAIAIQAEHIDPPQARILIGEMIGRMVDVMIGASESDRWARFMIREQLDPTPAFEILLRVMGPMHETAARLVAVALGLEPRSPEAKLRTFTVLGQVLVFRLAQTMVRHQLGWSQIGHDERAEIRRIVIDQAMAVLDRADRMGERP